MFSLRSHALSSLHHSERQKLALANFVSDASNRMATNLVLCLGLVAPESWNLEPGRWMSRDAGLVVRWHCPTQITWPSSHLQVVCRQVSSRYSQPSEDLMFHGCSRFPNCLIAIEIDAAQKVDLIRRPFRALLAGSSYIAHSQVNNVKAPSLFSIGV